MDEAATTNTVLWVFQNDRDGEEQTVLGALLIPPYLTFESLVDLEEAWRAEHPYIKDELFLDWLCAQQGIRRVPVEVYPLGG